MRLSGAWIGAAVALSMGLTGCLQPRKKAEPQEDIDQFSSDYYSSQKGAGVAKGASVKGANLPQPKKRVAVLRFWNDSAVKDENVGQRATEDFVEGLRTLGKDKVVLPEEIQGILDTKDFVSSDQIKVAQLVREGRRLGVNILVIGRIARANFRQTGEEVGILRQANSVSVAEVEVKVFDVNQGRELYSTARAAQAESSSFYAVEESLKSPEYKAELTLEAIHNAFKPIAPQVLKSLEKLSWEGRIVKSSGNKYYINAGRVSGIVPGDILKVMTNGEDIYDPSTGAYLGRSEGRWKGTVEVLDFIGPDAAVTRLHTGGQFVDGDLIRLY